MACILTVAGALTGEIHATTLAPVTLEEQIEDSAQIFRGRVISTRGVEEATAGGRRIVTFVQFAPVASYKGHVSANFELRFLGGKVGDIEMRVDGMPEFEVGKEYVLFVAAEGNRACPVSGWSQGSLPVDQAADSVRLSAPVAEGLQNDAAFAARAQVSGAIGDGKIGVAEFEASLRRKIREVETQ